MHKIPKYIFTRIFIFYTNETNGQKKAHMHARYYTIMLIV